MKFPYGNYHSALDGGKFYAVVEGEKNTVYRVDAWDGEDVYLSHAQRNSITVNGSFVRLVGDEEEL